METIKVGIIGTGFSAGFHTESLRRLPDVEVVAVAGSSLEKAEQMAKQYGIPRYYGDHHELIGQPDIEVIHNCTPNNLHYDINVTAMLAGKHLLSEKPLGMDSKQSAKLAELAEKCDVVSGVCFNYRHFPMVMQARGMVQSGKYGAPHLVMGSYLQDWLLYETDYSWRLDPELNGDSRAIADIGSHWCDTVQFVLGQRIIRVFADLHTVHPVRQKPLEHGATFGGDAGEEGSEEVEVSTEDCGSVLVHFEGGSRGVFTVSQVSAGRKNKLQFEISTRETTLYWDQENPNKLWEGHRNQANNELLRDPSLLSSKAAALAHFPGGHEEGWPDGMKNLLIDFYSEVKRRKGLKIPGKPQFANLNDGHRIMKVIDAVLESNAKQCWIDII
ncbi:Gfo/Idh/MocA family protein [Paenibacillus mendelii]|uniref:Gfo/Idh/MocA family protein n=1 Tax=Paenibacillus mendelii TaxID=206163 RepID=A0ABV6JJM6_9BACL|nr:Gfo/Idh/MocA family oxidoreductase [Paenibacillus mendelii]MCQ6563244.1 Gfo/Idh/MocA family oxidoreductase [Paenibacillus mendelii]